MIEGWKGQGWKRWSVNKGEVQREVKKFGRDMLG